MPDFMHSRILISHISGLLGVVGAGYALPNSPWVSFAVALLTGITQASHAYQSVNSRPTITTGDVKTALGQ